LVAHRNDGVDVGRENAMELGLRGRKALVTGASKGIGRACAEVLAEEGCDVVLVSRTAADLEAARAAIVAKHNVAVRFYPLDLSDSRNVDKLAEQALAWRDGALARAREISHPWSLSMALFYSTWLRQFLGDPERAEAETRELIAASAGQGDYLAILGRMVRGWALAMLAAGTADPETRRDEVERAVATMRETYDLNAATGARISQAFYLLLRIDACLLHGRFEEAREALEKAFAIIGSTGEGFWEPELHRQRGNLAARTGEENAEEHYQRALAISRRQRARSHELRAATDLARLRAGQGRREEARDLLAAVYDGFTEGFETADLRAARALLADLS